MKIFFFLCLCCYAAILQAQEITISEMDYLQAQTDYNKATRYFDYGNYDSAVVSFSKAIAINPNNSDYFFGRATSYNNLGLLAKAAEDMAVAIEMEPDQPDYHYFGANIFFKAKNYKAAVANYTKAIDNQGNNQVSINLTNCFYNRGVSFLMLKNYDKAVQDFTRVITLNSSFAQAYHNRGIALRNLSRREAACADFEQARTLGIEQSQQYLDRYCQLK